MEKRKHIIRWWLYMILLQWLIGLVGFFVLYNNYNTLTKSESIQEHYTNTFSLQLHNSAWSTWNSVSSGNNQLSWDIIYTGLAGTIHIGTKNIWGSDYQKKSNLIQRYQYQSNCSWCIGYSYPSVSITLSRQKNYKL